MKAPGLGWMRKVMQGRLIAQTIRMDPYHDGLAEAQLTRRRLANDSADASRC